MEFDLAISFDDALDAFFNNPHDTYDVPHASNASPTSTTSTTPTLPTSPFTLTFLEAMDILFNPDNPEYGKVVQGEWFAWRCYLKLNESTNQVELWDFVENPKFSSHYFSNGNIEVSKALLGQKFRTVSVLNKAGLTVEGVNYFPDKT